jgi:hypothetical protein
MLEKDMSHPHCFITLVIAIRLLVKYPQHIPPYIGVATKMWGFFSSVIGFFLAIVFLLQLV